MSSESVFVPFGFKNRRDYKELKTFKSENTFPYSGLWLFSGAQGNGKTLLLMHILKEMHNEYPNALIVSNISVFGIPCIPYRGIEDFEKYNNGPDGIIFVIDEIHTLFNSLESRNLPLSSVQVWSQNRKNRRVILGTSQRFSRVAKPIREQTKLLYVCYPPLFSFRRYSCFDATLIDDDGEYRGPRVRKHYYCPAFNVMTSYNTLEVVKRKNGVDKFFYKSSFQEEIESFLKECKDKDKIIDDCLSEVFDESDI